MTNIEYIEAYFNRLNTPEEKEQFEKRIVEDTLFAEEVAFYITANNMLQEELLDKKKQRFKAIYEEEKKAVIQVPVIKTFWRYAAAAAVIIIAVTASYLIASQRSLPQRLADEYMRENWQTLSATMNAGGMQNNEDSLQHAIEAFNSGKPEQALLMLEEIYQRDTLNYSVKKYAGIVSLHLKQYDKALRFFSLLSDETNLHINPGKLYMAVALLKRNKGNDKANAITILKEIAEKNLQEKEQAVQWLEELK